MSLTKRAAIRYQALDRCFSNRCKEFYIDDLIEACSKAFYDFDVACKHVCLQTIFNHLDFLSKQAKTKGSHELSIWMAGGSCFILKNNTLFVRIDASDDWNYVSEHFRLRLTC